MRVGSANALKNGVFMGAMLIICAYVLYLTDRDAFIRYKSWVVFLPFLILLFKTGADARRLNGGWISFKNAFKEILFAAVIGITMCTSYEHILFNYIDPELKLILKDISVESLSQMGTLVSESTLETFRDKIDKENLYSIGYTLSTYVVRLLTPGVVFSLLISFIIKRQKPILSNKTKQV